MRKKFTIDKNAIFLIVIIIIAVTSLTVIIGRTIVDPFEQAVKNGSIINIAFIVEKDGKPVFTEVLLYYPQTARAALLDIPVETGLIIKSLNRTDRIDALYEKKRPTKYVSQIEDILKTTVDYYIVMDTSQFIHVVDLLEGCTVFIPESVNYELDGKRVFLPFGNVVLDGEKMLDFILYKDTSRPDWEYIGRFQDSIKTLVKNFGQHEDYLKLPSVLKALHKNISTNLPAKSLKNLLNSFAKVDSDKII